MTSLMSQLALARAKLYTGLAVVQTGIKVNTNMDTNKMVGGIVDIILEISKYMGVIIAITGIFMTVVAYKDDNAEQQSRGVRLAVVGGVLLGLKTLLSATGIIS